MDVATHTDDNLSAQHAEGIAGLLQLVWPKPDRTFAQRLQALYDHIEENRRQGIVAVSFAVWDGQEAIAHARTFPRLIHTSMGDLTVMALAAVCVSPQRRGEGLGKLVTEEAFKRIDSGDFKVSLFQTGVPEFYSRLGARQIGNRFVNRLNTADPEANPWWDKHIMIYPASADWPEGTIGLNGPGY
jgi:predicted N-acetyltransferase YhbS